MPMSGYGRKIWAAEIERAQALVAKANAHPGDDQGEDYRIDLDPEDFLLLVNGHWD